MKLKVGDSIPVIKAKNHFDEEVIISPDQLDAPIIIYFYPKDDTPGCTKEACSFRDAYTAFSDENVEVFGVSADSPKRHQAFREKYKLPFTLLSDAGNKLRKEFGVPTNLLGLIPGRVTYVIDRQGQIAHVFNSQSKAEKHVSEALKMIKQLKD